MQLQYDTQIVIILGLVKIAITERVDVVKSLLRAQAKMQRSLTRTEPRLGHCRVPAATRVPSLCLEHTAELVPVQLVCDVFLQLKLLSIT